MEIIDGEISTICKSTASIFPEKNWDAMQLVRVCVCLSKRTKESKTNLSQCLCVCVCSWCDRADIFLFILLIFGLFMFIVSLRNVRAHATQSMPFKISKKWIKSTKVNFFKPKNSRKKTKSIWCIVFLCIGCSWRRQTLVVCTLDSSSTCIFVALSSLPQSAISLNVCLSFIFINFLFMFRSMNL